MVQLSNSEKWKNLNLKNGLEAAYMALENKLKKQIEQIKEDIKMI